MAPDLQTKIITITTTIIIIIINTTAAWRGKYHSNMEKMNCYSLISSILKKTKNGNRNGHAVLTMEVPVEATK